MAVLGEMGLFYKSLKINCCNEVKNEAGIIQSHWQLVS